MRVFALALAVCVAACGDAAPDPDVDDDRIGHDRMVERLASVAAIRRQNPFIGEKGVEALRAQAADLGNLPFAGQRAKVLYDLGRAEYRHGDARAAIETLARALAIAETSKDVPPDATMRIRYRLGVAYLRLGETENCCARASPESCILPFRGAAIHTQREGSENAMRYFTIVAEANGENAEEARWLLNLAAMTLGEHPDAVPEALRIPPEAFESDEPFPRFENVAAAVGLNTFGLAGGLAVEDFDGDGDLDILESNWDPAVALRYWENGGDGSFADRSEAANLTGILGGLNLVHADYDNDGDADVLVLRGAWLGALGRQPNSLLRNDGKGRFVDVTYAAGLAEKEYPTQTGAWADYDLDGDLDLYIGNEPTDTPTPGQLFRNNGDGTFTDVADEAGVRNDRFTKSVVWGDYNNDRYPDLYISNIEDSNRLYRNRGDGTFEDVAPRLRVTRPKRSFPAWFWDFDNDGHLDLFVSAYIQGLAQYTRAHTGRPADVAGMRLYRNDGHGGFKNVAAQRGLHRPHLPMGANFGDLDGDGWLDFYLGTGQPIIEELTPNAMYRNKGGRRFANVTSAGGFGHLQKGHAIVFADLDHDGDQDVFEQMGGAFAGDPFHNTLFENPGFGNRWITVRVVGKESNRSGIGTRLRVVVREGGTARVIHKRVNTGASFGSNPLRQNIGLGKAESIDRLEVYWPKTDRTQVFRDLPLDRLVVVTEGEAQPRVIEQRPIPFTTASSGASRDSRDTPPDRPASPATRGGPRSAHR